MKQPELGRKISELRKAKGLTQEELVDKCNLSVRTLQRIESGDVMPRNYTIKIIFATLDYSPKNSNKFSITGFVVSNWLEQFYRYFIDLFNLKTNKMKKLSILGISFSALVFGLFVICNHAFAQEKNKTNSVNIATSNLTRDDFRGFGVKAEKHVFDSINAKAIFRIKDELIAKDVIIVDKGVKICSQLIRFDVASKEFVTVIFDGKISLNSVIIVLPKLALENDSSVKYSGDKINKDGDKLIITGNAKFQITSEIVEAGEIIIQTN
jgi:transcriptional regulator with XRE-family HTH domain